MKTAKVLEFERQDNKMITDLPEPLTPGDCDLSNFPYFSFDAAKFRDSDFALTVDPAAGFRAVMLWSAAWHQKPAASLPNNDKVLFRLSGCMSMDEWLSIKEEALYGFVLCSDGRLYHKYLAEHACKAFSKSRKAKAAVASRKDRQPDPVQKPNGRKANVEQTFNDNSTNVPTNVVLGEERRGEGEESKEQDSSTPQENQPEEKPEAPQAATQPAPIEGELILKGEGEQPAKPKPPAKQKKASKPDQSTGSVNRGELWAAYAEGYKARYKIEPVRNAKVNSQMVNLVKRIGADAIAVAGWFPQHNNSYYIQRGHSVDNLLADCEKLRTEWATGNQATAATAKRIDRTQTNYSAAEEAKRMRQARNNGGNS